MKRYRIVDGFLSTDIPVMREYHVLRKTERGAWICDEWARAYFANEPETADLRKRYGARFVIDGDGKRWAYETEDLARKSYEIRKKRQIQHAQNSIKAAEAGLHWLETGEMPARDVFTFIAGMGEE
jgi:hypothetical protein